VISRGSQFTNAATSRARLHRFLCGQPNVWNVTRVPKFSVRYGIIFCTTRGSTGVLPSSRDRSAFSLHHFRSHHVIELSDLRRPADVWPPSVAVILEDIASVFPVAHEVRQPHDYRARWHIEICPQFLRHALNSRNYSDECCSITGPMRRDSSELTASISNPGPCADILAPNVAMTRNFAHRRRG